MQALCCQRISGEGCGDRLRHPMLSSLTSNSSEPPESSGRSRRAWMVLALLSMTFVLYLAVQVFLTQSLGPQGMPPPFGRIPPPLLISLEFVLLMIAAWLIDGRLATRRLRFRPRLLLLAMILSALGMGLSALFGELFHPPQPEPGTWLHTLLTRCSHGALRGITTASFWVLGFVYPLSIERENLRVAAELAQLRSRLEPHFLLNTLNAIAGLLKEDPEQTRRLLSCLGDLLRDSLESTATHQTLAEEVAWLRRYAEILEIRHHGQLSFEWQLDPAALSQTVPRSLLQPIVENAVIHGALRSSGPGRVTIAAAMERSEGTLRLVCRISDNGPGLLQGPTRPGAFGLHAVRRRLQLEWPGSSCTLDGSAEGTMVTLSLPLAAMPRPLPGSIPTGDTLS